MTTNPLHPDTFLGEYITNPGFLGLTISFRKRNTISLRNSCLLLLKYLGNNSWKLESCNWINSHIKNKSITTVFVDTRLWKTKHPLKRFQNFRPSYVLSTDRIEIHQSRPLVWSSDILYVMLAVCDWWKTDGNLGNISAGVLFSNVAYQRKRKSPFET